MIKNKIKKRFFKEIFNVPEKQKIVIIKDKKIIRLVKISNNLILNIKIF
jgi:hypothetical protein